MPNERKYDLDYRPTSYWDLSDVHTVLLSRIKGEHRKRDARKLLETGRMEELREILLAEGLDESTLAMVSRMHPMLMGGEYLPDYEEEEVEIARVSLDSTTADVISIRARRTAEGIRYRVVDEYETEYRCVPELSEWLLSTGKLITLIDTAESFEIAGLVKPIRDFNVEANDNDPEYAAEMVDFVTVSSDFYPQPGNWYEEEAEEWLARIREKYRAAHDDNDDGGGGS
jgi:hypothetical protein